MGEQMSSAPGCSGKRQENLLLHVFHDAYVSGSPGPEPSKSCSAYSEVEDL